MSTTKLYDYIYNIELIRDTVELDVVTQMYDTYAKAANILEYYNGNDLSSFKIFNDDYENTNIIQEGKIMDDVKKQSNGKSTLNKIFFFIPRLLKSLFRWITGQLKNNKSNMNIEKIKNFKKKNPKVMIAIASILGIGGASAIGYSIYKHTKKQDTSDTSLPQQIDQQGNNDNIPAEIITVKKTIDENKLNANKEKINNIMKKIETSIPYKNNQIKYSYDNSGNILVNLNIEAIIMTLTQVNAILNSYITLLNDINKYYPSNYKRDESFTAKISKDFDNIRNKTDEINNQLQNNSNKIIDDKNYSINDIVNILNDNNSELNKELNISKEKLDECEKLDKLITSEMLYIAFNGYNIVGTFNKFTQQIQNINDYIKKYLMVFLNIRGIYEVYNNTLENYIEENNKSLLNNDMSEISSNIKNSANVLITTINSLKELDSKLKDITDQMKSFIKDRTIPDKNNYISKEFWKNNTNLENLAFFTIESSDDINMHVNTIGDLFIKSFKEKRVIFESFIAKLKELQKNVDNKMEKDFKSNKLYTPKEISNIVNDKIIKGYIKRAIENENNSMNYVEKEIDKIIKIKNKENGKKNLYDALYTKLNNKNTVGYNDISYSTTDDSGGIYKELEKSCNNLSKRLEKFNNPIEINYLKLSMLYYFNKLESIIQQYISDMNYDEFIETKFKNMTIDDKKKEYCDKFFNNHKNSLVESINAICNKLEINENELPKIIQSIIKK